jgi:hypothetical protein
MVKNAGLKHVRLHDLRHTFATLLRKKGIPIEVIRKFWDTLIPRSLSIFMTATKGPRATADAMDEIFGVKSHKIKQGAFVRKSLEEGKGSDSGSCRDRTCDHLIKSQMLYQLS